MPDLVIEYGTQEWNLVRFVFFNGDVQFRVASINFTKGCITRPYTGPCLNEDQVKVGPGYVFDTIADDFILETVCGEVTVEWTDKAAGQAWMRHHAH